MQARLLAPFFALVVASVAVAASTPDEARRAGDAALDRFIESGGAIGVAAAVAIGPDIVWEGAAGLADRETGIRATTESQFGIGSVSKALCAALLVDLHRDGRIDLDAPLATSLDDLPSWGDRVTPRHILSHTSGLDDAFATPLRYTMDPYTTTEAYEGAISDVLLHAPGERTTYSTGSFSILAELVERTADATYDDALRARVLEPSGMAATEFNDPRADLPNRSAFYEPDTAGVIHRVEPFDPSHKRAGAGYVSTAADLARFGASLLDGDLLGDEGLHLLFTSTPLNSGEPSGYALAFATLVDEDGREIRHIPGGGPGISSWLVIAPDQEFVLAIVTNTTNAPVGGAVMDEIAAAFLPPATGD